MKFELQYGQPEQFIKLTQLIAPFDGTLDMDPDSFRSHENGNATLVVSIPESNVPAFEKIVGLFELSEYCKRL